MTSVCVLPGCSSSRKKRPVQFIQLLWIPRVDKKWKTNLFEFCCQYRDRRAISELARKNNAGICDKHFKNEDFHIVNGKRKVIPGRMPSLHLPVRKSARLQRKNETNCQTKTRQMGLQCPAYGCNKRRKHFTKKDPVRSDSEGSDDEESKEKRKHLRTFHLFPSDPILLRKWLINIRRKDWVPDSKSRICSDHFKEKDIIRLGLSARLKPGSLPTRFKLFEPHFKEHTPSSDNVNSKSPVWLEAPGYRNMGIGPARESQWVRN